jgi:hypothetical protein
MSEARRMVPTHALGNKMDQLTQLLSLPAEASNLAIPTLLLNLLLGAALGGLLRSQYVRFSGSLTNREDLGAKQRASFDALALPTLLNCDRREYWISRDGSIRLTLDDQLSFVPQRSSLAPQMRGSIPWGRMRVLELKAPVTSMKSVREAARGFPYRPARFSKYTAGMELSLPHRVTA